VTPTPTFEPIPRSASQWAQPPRASRLASTLLLIAALVGATFSAVSTSDFMQFLDRQVHSIHCSFIPGAGVEVGESGCKTVMMSPYSSYFRESVWGGVPVSVWSLAVFAFLVYRAGVMAWRGSTTRGEATFLLAATGLPVMMSLIYGYLSVVQVGATCKVCVGIYASSVAVFGLALIVRVRTPASARSPQSQFVWLFSQGVAFVALLTAVFFLARPPNDVGQGAAGCGTLVQGDDPAGVMLELKSGRVESIEVLDPLCPSCKAFDARLSVSGSAQALALKGVLFPLDSTCNWMISEELHPGACAVSEAILCATGLGEKRDHAAGRKVLAWAFKHQESLREEAKQDQKAMRAGLEQQFPEIKGCLGGPQVKNKLTKSLRWAVANGLSVLTPQLFVRDRRMCDEDTDLGLDYTLRKMVASTSQPKRGHP
jgi:uncharacterized membrane protein